LPTESLLEDRNPSGAAELQQQAEHHRRVGFARAQRIGEEPQMRVQELMTQEVCITEPGQSIRDAAEMMARLDCGSLPVAENDRLVGIITDRDIAVRAIASGKGPDTPVKSVMSNEVLYCFADQDLDEICANMAEQRIRRLPVLNREKQLVGIVSLGDIALTNGNAGETSEALHGISKPGGCHSQSARAL
jgi:CBS domain-containing protein